MIDNLSSIIREKDTPTIIKDIYQTIQANSNNRSNLDSFQEIWRNHLEIVKKEIPEAFIEGDGEIIYTGELSPGCRACKEGSWDCIFITMRCNLDCNFCSRSNMAGKDYAGLAYGANPKEVTKNYARTKIKGIGFSGGEAFLEPKRLFDWFVILKQAFPDNYFWIYTNGLLAKKEMLHQIGKLGIDEIRFNMAATNYTCPDVIDNLKSAVEIIPRVTVEIPAVPDHSVRILSSLEKWATAGVKYLNCHELMREKLSNSMDLSGDFKTLTLEDGHQTDFCYQSRLLTLNVMKTVLAKKIPISVNDCSSQSKIRQLRGRRRSLSPLVKKPYEKMIADNFLERICVIKNKDDYQFIHPDLVSDMKGKKPHYRFVKIIRSAPLSIYDKEKWISIVDITEGYQGLQL